MCIRACIQVSVYPSECVSKWMCIQVGVHSASGLPHYNLHPYSVSQLMMVNRSTIAASLEFHSTFSRAKKSFAPSTFSRAWSRRTLGPDTFSRAWFTVQPPGLGVGEAWVHCTFSSEQPANDHHKLTPLSADVRPPKKTSEYMRVSVLSPRGRDRS